MFFDIDDIADEQSAAAQLPSAEKFAQRMRRLGLGDGHKSRLRQHRPHSAARPWWMLRVFGHRDVAHARGGLPKWLAEGRPVTTRRA